MNRDSVVWNRRVWEGPASTAASFLLHPGCSRAFVGTSVGDRPAHSDLWGPGRDTGPTVVGRWNNQERPCRYRRPPPAAHRPPLAARRPPLLPSYRAVARSVIWNGASHGRDGQNDVEVAVFGEGYRRSVTRNGCYDCLRLV